MATSSEILKAFAAEGRAIKAKEEEETRILKEKEAMATNTVSSSRKKVSYEIEVCDYPDLIIKKTTPKTTSTMVVMPSSEVFFIKKGAGDNAENIPFEPNHIRDFMKDADGGIDISADFWIKRFEKGKSFAEELCGRIQLDGFCGLVRDRILAPNLYLDFDANWIIRVLESYKQFSAYMRKFRGDEKVIALMMYEPEFCQDLLNLFGTDCFVRFLQEYKLSLAELAKDRFTAETRYIYGTSGNLLRGQKWEKGRNHEFERGYPEILMSDIPRMNMSFSSFCDYILYTSVNMGYGRSISNFLREWNDTLEMQFLLYGKIKEKYPKDLPLMHSRLAYKCTVLRDEIDEKKFFAQAAECRKYERVYGEYTFLAPKTRQDFLDEATAQANCLASYINRFIAGDCMIFFMRKRKSPEKSLVTIEVVDGNVVQAKRERNRNVSPEESATIHKWAECVFDAKR